MAKKMPGVDACQRQVVVDPKLPDQDGCPLLAVERSPWFGDAKFKTKFQLGNRNKSTWYHGGSVKSLFAYKEHFKATA